MSSKLLLPCMLENSVKEKILDVITWELEVLAVDTLSCLSRTELSTLANKLLDTILYSPFFCEGDLSCPKNVK